MTAFAHGTVNFEGLSGPLKHIGSICCGARSKRDQSVLSNSTSCHAAFHLNSSTIRFFMHECALETENAGVRNTVFVSGLVRILIKSVCRNVVIICSNYAYVSLVYASVHAFIDDRL